MDSQKFSPTGSVFLSLDEQGFAFLQFIIDAAVTMKEMEVTRRFLQDGFAPKTRSDLNALSAAMDYDLTEMGRTGMSAQTRKDWLRVEQYLVDRLLEFDSRSLSSADVDRLLTCNADRMISRARAIASFVRALDGGGLRFVEPQQKESPPRADASPTATELS